MKLQSQENILGGRFSRVHFRREEGNPEEVRSGSGAAEIAFPISEELKQRKGYISTVYKIAQSTDRIGQEGKVTLRAFEVFNLPLTRSEEQEVIDQIKNNPQKHVFLLKKEVLDLAQNCVAEVVLKEDMGIIPKGFIDKKVNIADNCPVITDDAKSDEVSNLPDVSKVRVSAASLVQIKVGDLYLVSLNKNSFKKGKLQVSPIGGAYDFNGPEGKALYEKKGIVMSPDDEKKPNEMRQSLLKDQVPLFLKLFNQGVGREISPLRELTEELVGIESEENVFKEPPISTRTE